MFHNISIRRYPIRNIAFKPLKNNLTVKYLVSTSVNEKKSDLQQPSHFTLEIM